MPAPTAAHGSSRRPTSPARCPTRAVSSRRSEPRRSERGGPDAQRFGELSSRAEAELGEDLAEVILHGARADEQPDADLGVRLTVGGEARDLRLLRSQRVTGLARQPTHAPSGGEELAPGTLGEGLRADAREQLVRGAELLPRIHAPAGSPKPFAVKQTGASELAAHTRAAEPLDRLAIQRLRGVVVAEQRAGARLDAERPVGAGGARRRLQAR